MPVIMAIILVAFPRRVGFLRIIAVAVIRRRIRRQNCCTLQEIQSHIAFESNRKRIVRACRKEYRAAARTRSGLNRLIDCRRIDRLPVPGGSKRANIVNAAIYLTRRRALSAEPYGSERSGGSDGGIFQKIPALFLHE